MLCSLASARPGATLSYAFEPRLTSLTDQDAALTDYGFAPVGSPLLLTNGMRGRFWTEAGWILGAGMRYVFASNLPDGAVVPTTTSLSEMTLLAGRQLGGGLDFEADLGFAALSHSVGSEVQGGALVYLGPTLQGRLGYSLSDNRPFLHLALGGVLQAPLGSSHSNSLWEEPFERPLIGAVTLSIESGFGVDHARWSRP